MNTFLLEVIAPFVGGSPNNNLRQLISEIIALADEHEGIVLDPFNASSTTLFHRCCVDMCDEEYSLSNEVKALRKMFPDTRFVLEEESMPTE